MFFDYYNNILINVNVIILYSLINIFKKAFFFHFKYTHLLTVPNYHVVKIRIMSNYLILFNYCNNRSIYDYPKLSHIKFF